YARTICIEPELVEAVLHEVRQDRREELSSGSRQLRVATLQRLGGAEEIVGKHLEGVLGQLTDREKEVCSHIFKFLVTPGGTKIAHTASDLADFAKVPQDLLEPILWKLSGSETRITQSRGLRRRRRSDALRD